MTGRNFAAWSRALGTGICLIGVCGALGACGVSQLTPSFSGGIFGGDEKNKETTASIADGNEQQLAANTASLGGNRVLKGCPRFNVATGERTLLVYAQGGEGDDLAVIYRGEITNTARECAPSASGGLVVKYGFSGRVLLGPKGQPGTYTLPAKVMVVNASQEVVNTENVKVIANVPANQTSGAFSEVRESVVPLPLGTSPKDFRLYVAFDKSAARKR